MSNKNSSLESASGLPSGNRENMTGPDEGRMPENRLHDIDLQDRGESLEDHQRDRNSNGLAGAQDDSLETRKGGDGHDYRGVTRGD